MTFNLDQAVVYDIETLPNVFTLHMECLNSDLSSTWEISEFRDDRQSLISWFNYLNQTQTPMIGFNSVGFDYPVIHYIYNNPQCTVAQIYQKAMSIIEGNEKFAHTIWERDRFAPQIDLFKLHHFDNKAKTTSLKALQINMRSKSVVDSPVEFGTNLSAEQVDRDLIPYNKHDVKETKRFAVISLPSIKFRIDLISQFGIDVLNFNDTKIGEKILETRLGDDVCYDWSSGRKVKRQTIRRSVALKDIIFPYVHFENPEFKRILDFMKQQVLTPEDMDDPEAGIVTKGVFKGLTANVGGVTFYFGTGGVHASVDAQRFVASQEWLIRDIDVAALYPSIAIVNKLAPEHLGSAFTDVYAKIPEERNTYKKGTPQNAMLKLAANGAWGKSNSKFSVLYDVKYAMTIPINGQLLICMLAEKLINVPTLRIIQVNTDGITYLIHKDYVDQAKKIEKDWEAYTKLTLEDAHYNRMWIRDVNNYIAEDVKGKLKLKGAYWSPDSINYEESISNASPPCWYKDLSNIVSTRAAVACMIYGIDIRTFILASTNPFDFMCRARASRGSQLWMDDNKIQNTLRYYVAKQGSTLSKVSPPPTGHTIGQWKRAPKVTLSDYNKVMSETGGAWDERVCTKAKTKYELSRTSLQAGWLVADCNDADDFDFSNVNYDWYVNEAQKLIIN